MGDDASVTPSEGSGSLSHLASGTVSGISSSPSISFSFERSLALRSEIQTHFTPCFVRRSNHKELFCCIKDVYNYI